MYMEIPKQNLTNVIHAIILNNDSFFEMSKDFPEIAADLTTFKHNPNCSCKNKVTKFFNDKIESGQKDILDKYFVNKETTKNRILKIIKDHDDKVLTGKVITIDNSKEAWSIFAQECSSKFFRNFSVVEKGDKLDIYFI